MMFSLRLCCPRLAANGMAAWRQAGASAKFGREQKMLLPALYHTSMHPRLRQTARCATAFLDVWKKSNIATNLSSYVKSTFIFNYTPPKIN